MKERLCCDHVSWAASIGAKGDADFLEREQALENRTKDICGKAGLKRCVRFGMRQASHGGCGTLEPPA